MPIEHQLGTPSARAKLKPRGEPYWRQVIAGTFLGYRKGKRASAWVVRQRTTGGYAEQRLGTPDDTLRPDGEIVLTYSQAIARAQAVQVDARQPEPRHYGDGLTLNGVLDYYFAQHLAGKGSEAMAKASIARHVAHGIGEKLITALDAGALRAWHKALASKLPARRKPNPLAKRKGKSDADPTRAYDMADPSNIRARRNTANRVLSIVKAAFNFAWENDRLPANLPSYWMKVAPFAIGEDPLPRMLERDEIVRLLNAAAPDLRDLLSGALMTGARYGDLRRLRARDYLADDALVRIAQSKTGKTLMQPLTPEGIALFDRLTAGQMAAALVFARADGRAWERGDVRRPMLAAATAAQLVDVTFKTTRATYGKLLLQATRDIEMVAKALGHSDSRITRKHYAQYLPSELQRAVAQLPALGLGTDNKISRMGKKRRAG
nr:tyrosine-type recombinase/integrase [Lysobacter sp. CFH 32150]